MATNEDTRIVLDEMIKRLREEKKVSEQLLLGLQKLIEDGRFGDKQAVTALLDDYASKNDGSQEVKAP